MFLQRVLSGVVLVVLLAVTCLTGGMVLLLFTLCISLRAFYEMLRACGVCEKENNEKNLLALIGYVGILGYYALLYVAKAGSEMDVMLPVSLTMLLLMVAYALSFPKFHAHQVMATMFSFVYAPLLLSFLYLTRTLPNGVYVVWLIFVSSWVCDTFAYLVGMRFGKHKMAPRLSPKKSIEGAIGGVIGAGAMGFLYAFVLFDLGILNKELMWVFALIASSGAIFSQVGDLAASAIKRNYDIKDYGRLIPGHGGVMDRFDSMIFTAPMVYYLALLLLGGG